MRKYVLGLFLLSVTAPYSGPFIISIARAASLETQADDLPTRHEGLWRISTLSADAGLQVSEACVRAGDSIIGEMRQGCSKPQVTRHGDQTIVTIVCEEESQNNVTSLLFTGDYVAWYRAQGKITSRDRMSGAEMHSGFTIDAQHLRSNCEAADGAR